MDLFRILAAFMIFLFHTGIVGCEYRGIYAFVKMGPIFMTGFFLLSGFSLYHSCRSSDLTKLAQIKLFYKKRCAGILPLYWFTAIMYVLLERTENVLQNVALLPIEFLGIQSAFSSLFLYSHNSGTWFISCILLCYLIFPFLSECVKQMGTRLKVFLTALSIGILLYSPFIVILFEQPSIYTNPFFRMLEFFIGILTASLVQESAGSGHLKKILANKLVLFLELILLIESVKTLYKLEIGIGDYMLYSLAALPVFCLMLAGLSQADFPILKHSKTVRYLSDISYAFYLSQFFIWPIVQRAVQVTGLNTTVFKCALSLFIGILFSVLMHELIEKPCKKFFLRPHGSKKPDKTA